MCSEIRENVELDACDPISHLLALPPELRIHIYELVLLSQPGDFSLLQSSRKINMEAQPIIYQRPLSFKSQANMFLWVDRSRSCNLKRVKSLTLRLTDIDLTPLLCLEHWHTRTSVWDLYQQELERLDLALEVLPNIEHFAIIPPRARHSHLLRGMYLGLLSLIPQRCRRLEQLVVEDDEGAFDVAASRSGSVECTRPAQQMHVIHVAKSASPAALTNVGYADRRGEEVATPVLPQPRRRHTHFKSVKASKETVANNKARVRVTKPTHLRRALGCRQRNNSA
ncbi:hypothetical protein LTR74_007303 [Friedmanniomyces endolithicus]|nr:hypothetical protein LTR74_007303 [Friedmanniomyces endolithicus]